MQTVLVLSSALARMSEAPADATPLANGAFLAAFEEVGKSPLVPAGPGMGPSAAILPRVAGRLDPNDPGSMAIALDVAAGGRSALPDGVGAAEKDSQDPWPDEAATWVVIPMDSGPPAPGPSQDRLADVEGIPDRAANPLAAGPDRKSPGRGPSDQGLAARESVADAAQEAVDSPDDQMAAGKEPVAKAVLKALGELAGHPLSAQPDAATPSASLPPGPGEDDSIANAPNDVPVAQEPSTDPRARCHRDQMLQAGHEQSRVAAMSGRESLAAGPDADAFGAPRPSDRHGPAPDPEPVPAPAQSHERFHAPTSLTGLADLRGTASTHVRQAPANDTPAEQDATQGRVDPAPDPRQAAGIWERAFTSLVQPEEVIPEDKLRPRPDLSVGTGFSLAVGREGDITLADAVTGATGTTVAPATARPGGIVPVSSIPLAASGAMTPALWVLPDETTDPMSYESFVSPVGSAGTHTAATSAAGATAMPGAAGALPVPQVAAQLVAGLSQGADGSTELALSPDELGHVRLRMEPDAADPERLVVMINFERPETLDLFRRHAAELADALRAAGYSGVDIGFGQGNGKPDGFEHGAPRNTEPDRPDPAPLAQTAPRPSDGASLDLRL